MSNLPAQNCTEILLPDPANWSSIRAWRKAQRATLIESRIKMGSERNTCLQAIQSGVAETLSSLPPGIIGFYWPIKGEFDLRPVVNNACKQGWQAALPVVSKPAQPLEFHLWTPTTRLVRGFWNIPVPAERNVVMPSVLLVPLVGFDKHNYRLGYGGGYYDRTLAGFDKRPLTIGIGIELSRLETIYPQQHDIPMDRIVTEAAQDQSQTKI